jgi:hypothetical protein
LFFVFYVQQARAGSDSQLNARNKCTTSYCKPSLTFPGTPRAKDKLLVIILQ